MGRNRLAAGLLWSLVLALGITQVMMFMRIRQLQEQLADTRARDAGERVARTDSTSPPEMRPVSPSPESTEPRAPSPESRETAMKEAPALPSAAPVNAGQVEDIVRRLLKERDQKSPFADLINMEMEDPIVVMERELKLSPSQKLRIEDHMKARDAANDELMKGEWWKSDSKAYSEQWQAVHNNYEAAVKGELDYNQQQKYDELRKSGKLMDWGGSGSTKSVFIGGFRKVEDK